MSLPAQTSSQSDRPPLVFVSEGACPFECCTYREWVANRDMQMHDKPQGRVSASLKQGERVHATTGVVITHPLAFRVVTSEAGIPAGATAYLLHPVGEGYWRVWYKGNVAEIEVDEFPHGTPDYQWWAQVKTSSGQTGWVRMGTTTDPLPFDNVDACG